MKKVVIAGGSGFLGQILSDHFKQQGYLVTVLSRNHRLDRGAVRYVKWDGQTLGHWVASLEGADVLINLNGKSVDCRYNDANKQAIYDTRIDATWVLGQAVKNVKQPPVLWINASSATIYRHAEDHAMDECHGELGEGFSVDVCKKWEQSFFESHVDGVRQVALRIAIVLGRSGGAFHRLRQMTRFGLGGRQGSGWQMVSWIHEQDFVRVVQWVCDHPGTTGIYNVCAPNPVTNSELMRTLRKALDVPVGVVMPIWLLRIGAKLIQTETELILKSRWVIPGRLSEEGFSFDFPRVSKALSDLIHPAIEPQ